MDSRRTIYDGVQENTDSAAPDEEKVHRMAAAAASDGAAVTCGNYDYNMLNYEEVDHALRDAAEGREAAAEFFVLTSEGYFKYFRLQFLEEEITVQKSGDGYACICPDTAAGGCVQRDGK